MLTMAMEFDKNIMGQLHFKRNAYQIHQPIIGSHDIAYENTQMFVYCDVS
jgi:hypothetical protein